MERKVGGVEHQRGEPAGTFDREPEREDGEAGPKVRGQMRASTGVDGATVLD